jgi:Carbohydrate-binding module 48 (Isoamylase N-terminal domain)
MVCTWNHEGRKSSHYKSVVVWRPCVRFGAVSPRLHAKPCRRLFSETLVCFDNVVLRFGDKDRIVVKRDLEIWRGEPYPLGATLTEEGVNFALYSEDATAVELCLFDSPEPDAGELRIPVTEQTAPTAVTFGSWRQRNRPGPR